MKIKKNPDDSRTFIPEGDEGEILDYIDKTLGTTFILRKIQEIIDQRREQISYDEVIELHKNLRDLTKKQRREVIVDTIQSITMMDK